MIYQGKPENIIPSLIKNFNLDSMYYYEEVCYEEIDVL